MSKMHELIGLGLGMMANMEVNKEQWKDEIREKWEQSKKLPRKKKKRVRKDLLWDWTFACWSPYKDL